jgi:hypothetical protein
MSVLFIGHPKETHLALFAGGELGPLARWRIERHLQKCESCQTTVSDFFHLQGDLTELSELPSSVDWDKMALRIGQAVAQAGETQGERSSGFFSKPLVLRFGLATATVLCGFIVVQQWPLGQAPDSVMTAQNEPVEILGGGRLAEAPETDGLLSSSEATYAFADGDRKSMNEGLSKVEESIALPRQEKVQLENARLKTAPQEQAQLRDAQNKQKEFAVATEQPLPGDNLRAFAPTAPLKKSDSESFRAVSDLRANVGAGRGAGREANLETNDVSVANAPAPSTAPAGQRAAVGEADATLRAAVDQIRERSDAPASEVERAVGDKAEASADEMTLAEMRSVGAVRGQVSARKINIEKEGDAFGMHAAVGQTSIAPPSPIGQDVEVDVKMDGGLRYRTVDAATGRITITDVYAQ